MMSDLEPRYLYYFNSPQKILTGRDQESLPYGPLLPSVPRKVGLQIAYS